MHKWLVVAMYMCNTYYDLKECIKEKECRMLNLYLALLGLMYVCLC